MVQLVRYDRQGSKDMLFTLLAICSFAKVAYAATDQIAQPWLVEFGTTSGPDGPWNAIIQTVSWPIQNVTVFPSFTKSNLVVEAAACSAQKSACPSSNLPSWLGRCGLWSWMNSTPFEGSTWDIAVEPLRLQGQGTLISDRITFESTSRSSVFLDFVANSIDQNFTVNYPGPQNWYTLNTGFLSLDGASDTVQYTSVNGSNVTLNKTLPLAYEDGAIPSISYGLHIGSASQDAAVAGSLVLGGYDRPRCLTEPIQSSGQTFTLVDIGLAVADGGSPFPNAQTLPVTGLLRRNGSSIDTLDAYPNPGVPYLYLPQDTCSAIAEMLPVSFNESLGLYLWNASDPTFQNITSSPSYLSFEFSSKIGSVQTSSIKLPFALLNLTLESPLVIKPTSYFPCSPYTPSDGSTFHLGRAFLQAAFLAQNWQTQRLMLAQAPGPGGISQQITTIASTDTSVTPMIDAPSWYSTWSSTLTALAAESGNITTVRAAAEHSGEISGGEIEGIVIGSVAVIAIIAMLIFFLRRRKNKRGLAGLDKLPIHTNEKSEPPLCEADNTPWLCEMSNSELVEMPTSESGKGGQWSIGKDSLCISTKEWPMEMTNQAPIAELEGCAESLNRLVDRDANL